MTKPIHSVGVHEAKTQLSELLRRVEAGEVIEIRRNARPLARLVPVPHERGRHFGTDAGTFVIPEDFDAPLPDEVLAAFES
jgi:prevent-host-death family protein